MAPCQAQPSKSRGLCFFFLSSTLWLCSKGQFASSLEDTPESRVCTPGGSDFNFRFDARQTILKVTYLGCARPQTRNGSALPRQIRHIWRKWVLFCLAHVDNADKGRKEDLLTSPSFEKNYKMVFYFESNNVSPPALLFMGIDKNENEDLIRWGWPEDVWFHVDQVSSAHVYLRLRPGQTLDDVPSSIIEDAAQLVKANSIMGNKMNDISVVYTMWANLKKTPSMDVGQVGFHKESEVRKIKVAKRINDIVNRLNKTKREEHPDFRAEREKRDRLEREDKKKLLREQKKKEEDEEKRRKEEAELKNYNSLMSAESMGKYDDGNDSDDFM